MKSATAQLTRRQSSSLVLMAGCLLLQACAWNSKQTIAMPVYRIEQSAHGFAPYVLCDDCPSPTAKTLPQAPTMVVRPVEKPKAMTPLPVPKHVEVLVYFAFGSATLSKVGNAVLDEAIVKAKLKQPMKVIGGADSIGTLEQNIEIAMRRALVVRLGLLKRGIRPEQIEIVSRPTDYVAPNDSEQGRSRNRRAGISIEMASQ